MSWRAQKRRTAASSWSSKTRPTGLCGLHRISSRVRPVRVASSASRSTKYRRFSPSHPSGPATNPRPADRGQEKNGGYTGVMIMTSSPAAPAALLATARPGTIPGNHTIHSSGTVAPCRACR